MSKPITEIQPSPFKDYPAAHSMDTCWYAVDEQGELGIFNTDAIGLLPMLGVLGRAPEEEEGKLRTTAHWAWHQHRYYDDPESNPAKYFEAVGCSIFGQKFQPGLLHLYAPYEDGYYYWLSSPENPMRIESLPKPLRTDILVLKDYAFSSREPVNPLDYVHGGFTWGHYSAFPWRVENRQTVFPLPTTRKNWRMEDYLQFAREDDKYGHPGKFWFGVDDDSHLAVFRTDRFGAVPTAAQCNENKVTLFDLLSGTVKALPLQAQEKRPIHWLEYPFGLMPPRLLGFYHYDASWHHPIPYCRVGVPEEPLRLDDPSWEWLEMWNPVRLPGVRFASAPLVQPLESVDCRCVSDSYDDEWGNYTQAEIWIDAALDHVHLIGPDSVKRDDDERVLRRARRYVTIVNELGRKG